MFPLQRIIYSVGRVYNNHSTVSFLRPNILRKHSILATSNALKLRGLNSAPKNLQTNFYALSKTNWDISNSNAIFCKSNYSSANDNPQTSAQKLKKAVAEYGSVVIVFHVGISLISLGICYTLISSGLDLTAIISYVGLNVDVENKLATSTGAFVVAYAVHKVFAPARIGITLTATPFIVRYLRRVGWLKQAPKKIK